MMGNVNLHGDPDIPVKINIDLGQFLAMNQHRMRNPGTKRYEIMITYPNNIELETGSPSTGLTPMDVTYVRITFKKKGDNE